MHETYVFCSVRMVAQLIPRMHPLSRLWGTPLPDLPGFGALGEYHPRSFCLLLFLVSGKRLSWKERRWEGGLSQIPWHSCVNEREFGLDCAQVRARTAGKFLFYHSFSSLRTCCHGFLLCSLIFSWLCCCFAAKAKSGISRVGIYRSAFTDSQERNANFYAVQLADSHPRAIFSCMSMRGERHTEPICRDLAAAHRPTTHLSFSGKLRLGWQV